MAINNILFYTQKLWYDKAKKVSPRIIKHIEKYISLIQNFIDIKHKISIFLYPSIYLLNGDDWCYGLFEWDINDKNLVIIHLATEYRSKKQAHKIPLLNKVPYLCNAYYDMSYWEWYKKRLPLTLIHEFCHYEQWSQGKNLTERGIKIRTKNIWEKINDSRKK